MWIHGLWGCFFGMTVIILGGAVAAYRRGLRRIAINAAFAAVVSAFYVVAFLGGFHLGDADDLARFLAHLSMLVAGFLTYQLLAILSLLKAMPARLKAVYGLTGLCAVTLGLGWALKPSQAFAISSAVSCLLAATSLALSVRSAVRGERLAWVAVTSVASFFVALAGFGWMGWERDQAFPIVHTATALAATLYVVSLAYVIWTRYQYLIELYEVLAHGPAYDPVTRMRSHSETGQMVGAIFRGFRDKPAPMGIVVLTIANLYALEQLHGVAAVNNAFFVCAGRLRRWVPRQVDIGRLGKDGFVLIMQNCTDSKRVIDMARALEARLRRSVSLNTSRDVAQLGSTDTVWVAEIGVGVLMVANPLARGSDALALGKRLSRTAISYGSRIAWFDHTSSETVELSTLRPAQ